MFDLCIARLEAIEDLDVARIESYFFGYGFWQSLTNAQKKHGVGIIQFPAAGSAGGYDVGVAVNAQSPMLKAPRGCN